jgi:hypothetical protein
MLTTFSHKFENEGVFVFEMQGYEIMVVVRRKQCEQKVYSLTQENMNKLGITNKKKGDNSIKYIPLFFVIVAFILVWFLNKIEKK